MALCSAAIAAVTPVRAEERSSEAKPVPVEAFYRLAELDDAKLSPGGRWLAVKTGLGGGRCFGSGLFVDPKRICIAGASYGGYATLMGLVRHPELFRCGAAWVGVTDPRLMFDLEWLSDISDEARVYSLVALTGDPAGDRDVLAAVAPVELAARIKAPVLLAYGAKDRRVPLEHGDRMRAALRAAGNDPSGSSIPTRDTAGSMFPPGWTSPSGWSASLPSI